MQLSKDDRTQHTPMQITHHTPSFSFSFHPNYFFFKQQVCDSNIMWQSLNVHVGFSLIFFCFFGGMVGRGQQKSSMTRRYPVWQGWDIMLFLPLPYLLFWGWWCLKQWTIVNHVSICIQYLSIYLFIVVCLCIFCFHLTACPSESANTQLLSSLLCQIWIFWLLGML